MTIFKGDGLDAHCLRWSASTETPCFAFSQYNQDNVFYQYDHNVIPVWQKLNIIGRGISVSILDDGKKDLFLLKVLKSQGVVQSCQFLKLYASLPYQCYFKELLLQFTNLRQYPMSHKYIRYH